MVWGWIRRDARAAKVEAPEPATDPTPSTLGGVEIALEAEKGDTAPDSPARRLLLKQERLIEAQTAQLGRQRWRDFIITALGLIVLIAAALFVWDASRARGVVVQPFATPSDFEERGLGGRVVAAQLLDKLIALQAATESQRASYSYANDWGEDIQVEIADTGVSISELRRFLRDWLGDQTKMSGEVTRLSDGRVAIAARVGAGTAHRFEGAEADLDTMLQQAAQAIYEETQPYRYTVWLNQQQRFDEARPILMRLTTGQDTNDRVWAYSGLSVIAATLAEKERWWNAALRVRPGFGPILYNRIIVRSSQGREEEAYRDGVTLLSNAAALRRELEPSRAEFAIMTSAASRATAERDPRRAAATYERGIGLPASPLNMKLVPFNAISAHVLAHDMAAARRVMDENGLDTSEGAAELSALLGSVDILGQLLAAETEDWAKIRDINAQDLADLDLTTVDFRQADPTLDIRVGLAEAQARLGQVEAARATIRPTPLDCTPCLRARGLVEAQAGNAAAADRWMRRAVQLAPSLPAANARWAEIYLARGDAPHAIAQARLAIRKGPQWADPRKLWGDALMLQQQPRAAMRQYQRGLRLAPNWGALHLALGRAQAAAGRPKEARISFQTASRLEMSAADKAAVERLLSR